MPNTPPPPPIHERDSNTLVEDLCVALREVGVRDGELPEGPRVLSAINDVRSIKQVLDERGVDVADRLATLSAQTRWRMADLLLDCLSFPEVVPFVKEEDGIRRELRCGICLKAEYPQDDKAFLMCNGCLTNVRDAIKTRTPTDRVLLFRTYSLSARCKHADADTVLARNMWTDTFFGNCEQCFQDGLDRRARSMTR